MAAELTWRTTSGALSTSLSWTTLQRTSVTATETRDLVNEYVVSGAATTATDIQIRVGAQSNVGEPFLFDGSLELVGAQWLRMSQLPAVYNPTGLTGPDVASYSVGETGVGGTSVFSVIGAIPARVGRRFSMFLSAPTSGSATSYNAVRIIADWDRGILQRPSFDQEILGDAPVFRGDWGEFRCLRGTEDAGLVVKQDATAGTDTPSLDTVIIEPAVYQLGTAGIVATKRSRFVIASVDLDSAAAALTGTEEWSGILTKDSTGIGYTLTKSVKAASGASVVPSAPTVNDIPICEITKRNDQTIITSDINMVVLHEAAITYDGAGADVDVDGSLTLVANATQNRGGRVGSGVIANSSEHHVRRSGLGVTTINTTDPAVGEATFGLARTGVGTVNSYRNHHPWIAASSYRARARLIEGSYREPDMSDVIQWFGTLDRTTGSSAIVEAGATQTVTFAGGHQVAVRTTAVTDPGVLELRGTVVDGSMNENAEGNGPVEITIVAFGSIAGASTVTVSVSGTETVLTEGVDWTAGVSNTATADSLATACDGIAGVNSDNSAGVLRIWPDADGTTVGATVSEGLDAMTVTTSEVLFVNRTAWQTTDARFFASGADNDPDVTLTGIADIGTVTVVGLHAGIAITLAINNQAVVTFTEGVEWADQGAGSEAATALLIAAVINTGLTTVTATASAATVVIHPRVLGAQITTITTTDAVNLPVTSDGLSITATSYRARPWQFGSRFTPFHVGRMVADIVPKHDGAQCRLRLYKILKDGSGPTAIFDSGLKTQLAATGAGINQIPIQFDLHLSGNTADTEGIECDTDAVFDVPDLAIIDVWAGEWIYAELSDVIGIESARIHTLKVYDHFTS